jgi:4a-hydroxytetrahydrobiopterin dehydratase
MPVARLTKEGGATELWKRRPLERAAGTPTLTEAEAAELDGQLSGEWHREGTTRLRRELSFGTFAAAFAFATRLALLAEAYQHHPVLEVSWGRLVVWFTTDSIGGLSENDYIMAARIDRLT